MAETRQMINRILEEIEQDDVCFEAAAADKKSMSEVMNILLNKENTNIASAESEKPSDAGIFDMKELQYWREKNNQLFQTNYYHPIVSAKPVIGKGIVLVKKVLRKLMKSIIVPILMEQNDFNASVTASINSLYNNEISTEAFILQQKQRGDQLQQLRGEIEALKAELEGMRKKNVYESLDYVSFEDHFRGSKEEIKNRQEEYLSYFKEGSNVIDLGCGRGEFMELLNEKGIQAVGVDLYEAFVWDCKQRGLNVIQADAVDYLNRQESESVDGIFAAQLVEHLDTEQLVQLCYSAYRTLKTGGCIVLDTPNPLCLSIYTNAFYIDPTHNKPVHPKTLEYFLSTVGFKKIEIVYPEGSKIGYRLPLLDASGVANLQDVNDGLNCLSDLIFGSQDYAIIAYK